MRTATVPLALFVVALHAAREAHAFHPRFCPKWCDDQSARRLDVQVKQLTCAERGERLESGPGLYDDTQFKGAASLTPEVCDVQNGNGWDNIWEAVCRGAGACNVQVNQSVFDFSCVCHEPSLPAGWEKELVEDPLLLDSDRCPLRCSNGFHPPGSPDPCDAQCPSGCVAQERTDRVFVRERPRCDGYGMIGSLALRVSCFTAVETYSLDNYSCYVHGVNYHCLPYFADSCDAVVQYAVSSWECSCPTDAPHGLNVTTTAAPTAPGLASSSQAPEVTDQPTGTTAEPTATTAAATETTEATETTAATTETTETTETTVATIATEVTETTGASITTQTTETTAATTEATEMTAPSTGTTAETTATTAAATETTEATKTTAATTETTETTAATTEATETTAPLTGTTAETTATTAAAKETTEATKTTAATTETTETTVATITTEVTETTGASITTETTAPSTGTTGETTATTAAATETTDTLETTATTVATIATKMTETTGASITTETTETTAPSTGTTAETTATTAAAKETTARGKPGGGDGATTAASTPPGTEPAAPTHAGTPRSAGAPGESTTAAPASGGSVLAGWVIALLAGVGVVVVAAAAAGVLLWRDRRGRRDTHESMAQLMGDVELADKA